MNWPLMLLRLTVPPDAVKTALMILAVLLLALGMFLGLGEPEPRCGKLGSAPFYGDCAGKDGGR